MEFNHALNMLLCVDNEYIFCVESNHSPYCHGRLGARVKPPLVKLFAWEPGNWLHHPILGVEELVSATADHPFEWRVEQL